MRARVRATAIVGGGLFLKNGQEVEVAELGEFLDSLVRSGAVVVEDLSSAVVASETSKDEVVVSAPYPSG